MEGIRIKLNEDLIKKIKPGEDALIMWGGGKDSTASLLLASLYTKKGIFNKLIILTFDNFLSTKSVIRNRRIILNHLKKEGINFEWIVEDFGGKENVYLLYKQALLKTEFTRAVCAICNMMSETFENRIINERRIRYRISGNTIDEFNLFKQWAKILDFKKETNNPRYDTLNGWSKVFDEWLDYLSLDLENKDIFNKFRLPKPNNDDPAIKVENLNLFQYHPTFLDPNYRIEVITLLGWYMPNVKEGIIGTETDCMFPSIIFGLHLLKNKDYREELKKIKKENMIPENLLYRGLGNKDLALEKTEDFLNELGIGTRQINESTDMPLSFRKYLRDCLLPVR